MENKIKEMEEKKCHLLRLKNLTNANFLFVQYAPSKIEREILRLFNTISTKDIAYKLNINRSYVYAVIEKYKSIYTKKEILNRF